MIRFCAWIIKPFLRFLDFIRPLADLATRLWIAWIFFQSGLVKLQSWPTTIALFQSEYHVPFLSSHAAAVLGTAAELILPVLLAIGLGGRLTILLFFVYNASTVVSYHFLWTPDGWNGLAQHINWGLLLALLMTHGSGKLSVDYWLKRRHGHHFEKRKKEKLVKADE